MSPTIVSAPGKVLLAGGYLVLDPKYSGTVVSTSARFYTIVRTHPTGWKRHIVVRSPQFLDGSWTYEVRFSHRGEVGIAPAVSPTSNKKPNKFVQLAIERVLFIAIEKLGAQNIREVTADGLEIIIVGDNDFYSQRGQLASLNLPSAIASLSLIPRFAHTQCELRDVHKTGLGSSAALITSLVAALLIHFSVVSDLNSDVGKAWVHNVAQYAHCLAQGKVGSGFDVSSATYGSQLYRRFDPEIIQPLMKDGDVPQLSLYLDPTKATWNHVIRPFKLPPLTRLMLADVDAGTDTPAAVGKVLSWKKSNPEKALALWTALATENDGFANALTNLTTLYERSSGAYQTAVNRLTGYSPDKWATLADQNEIIQTFAAAYKYTEAIRAKMREMGNLSDVPIEPEEQTRLLNACISKVGVIGGGVPGAGGFDAIWVLVFDFPNAPNPTSTALVEAVWSGWKEMNVSPLSCSESLERGVRLEGDKVMEWLQTAKYL